VARVDSAKTEFMGAQGVGFEVVWRGADWRAATGIEAHGYCIAVVSVLSSYRLEGCRCAKLKGSGCRVCAGFRLWRVQS